MSKSIKSIKQSQQSSDYTIIKCQIAQIKVLMQKITQKNAAKTIDLSKLSNFQSKFEQKLVQATLSRQQFDDLAEIGMDLHEKVASSYPFIMKYQQDMISYDQLLESLQMAPVTPLKFTISEDLDENLKNQEFSKKEASMLKTPEILESKQPEKRIKKTKKDNEIISSEIIEKNSLNKPKNQKAEQILISKTLKYEYQKQVLEPKHPQKAVEYSIIPKRPQQIHELSPIKAIDKSIQAPIKDSRQLLKRQDPLFISQLSIEKITPVKDNMTPSRSNTFSRFQQKKLLKSPIIEQDGDYIVEPDETPYAVSFQQESLIYNLFITKSKGLSFRQFIQQDNKIIPQVNKSTTKLIENNPTNIFKSSSNQRKRSRIKSNSFAMIQTMIKQKQQQYKKQIKIVQESRTKKIIDLSNESVYLLKQKQYLQKILSKQNKQLVNLKNQTEISSKTNLKLSNFLNQNNQLKNSIISNQKYKINGKSSIKYSQMLVIGNLIEIDNYLPYFDNIQQTHKKALLLPKSLLFKNQRIEIGCTTLKQKDTILITLYITPQQDINSVIIAFDQEKTSGLVILLQNYDQQITQIRKRQQLRLNISVQVTSIPYHLTELVLQYKTSVKYHNEIILIPSSLNKFINNEDIADPSVIDEMFKENHIIRSEQFSYNRFLKRHAILQEYFPRGRFLNDGRPNTNGFIEYICKATLLTNEFYMKFAISENKFMSILISSQKTNPDLQYLAAFLQFLFKKANLST